jgi:hypothetical protein
MFIGIQLAGLLPGEVQRGDDDAAQHGRGQIGEHGDLVTAMITSTSLSGTLFSTRSEAQAKVCCDTTNITPPAPPAECARSAATETG